LFVKAERRNAHGGGGRAAAGAHDMSGAMADGPLAHLCVLDLTDLRGALVGRLLADLGADVVKVEPPGGDPDRWRPPFVGDVAGPDRSLAFAYRHANKRGLVLDLDTLAARRRLDTLCDRADVLVENHDAARRSALALGPAAVAARHPHLVHVVLADCGLDGPHAGWRLEALPAFAASGALAVCGFPDRPPCWLPGYVAHDCAAAFAVAGALAALLDRARSGRGQTVEVSVQEAALSGLYPWTVPLADYQRHYPVLATAPPRNADGNYMVLPVADGWVRVLPATVPQWRAFVELLGSPEALAGDEWTFLPYRIVNGDLIRAVASEALRNRSRATVLDAGRRLGVPIGPVNTPDEFVEEPQTVTRGYFRRLADTPVGDAPVAVAPFVFSRTPVALRRGAPRPGEHDGAGFPPRQADARPAPAAPSPTPPVLPGLRVLSLGVVAVGPEVGWLLAELGADVVKVESRTKLDPLRAVTLEPDAPNKAFTFNDENRGHQSVLVDLATEEGRRLVRMLAARADVVIENNRGGVARRWGLDYEDVRRLRPDVVYLASQGYGRGGPLGEVQGFGPMNGAVAGACHLWNHPDAPYPGASSLNHPDHVASKLGLAAVLAALEHRRRTGEGQLIDLAQSETAAFLLGEAYLEGPCTGRPARPMGNAVVYAIPHGVYPAAGDDRWIAIAVVGDVAWERLRTALGWPDDPALATLAGRLARRAELDERVAAWTRERTAGEAADLLQAAGVSAAPVYDGDDIRADAHLLARGAIVTVEHPEIGPERHAGNPIRLSRTPLVTAGPAPLLGQHTDAVLGRWLGLDAVEVAQLRDAGVCR
jgi:crotonobetainyl-CoA:carnitine CoA-transferase CaiB-like acyl-CoA transferase